MNELRWILLAAGALLILGIYLWGMRSRWQGRGDAVPDARRPAVFTGGASSFESTAGEADAADDVEDLIDEPAVLRAEPRSERRIEPSLGLDPDEVRAPALEPRRTDFDDEERFEAPAIARREPTLSTARTEGVPLRQEPTLQPEPVYVAPRPAAAPAPEPVAPPRQAEPAAAPRTQKIVAIRVTAQAPARFDGGELLAALRSEGLGYGRYEIFHRLHDDGRPVFSVASLREPGTFDLESMPSTPYPGVALFAVLPGPIGASDAFDEMIFSARALATHLNGALADERGAPLTAQRVQKLREETLEFERGGGA